MVRLYGNERNGGSIEIEILKRIPVGAGLAGGSGNGAAVIHGLNALWNLDLSLTEICGICEELGSDVPFCAVGQAVMNKKLPRKICKSDIAATCVRATGRGTHIRKTTSLKKPIVLFAITNNTTNNKMIKKISLVKSAEIGRASCRERV